MSKIASVTGFRCHCKKVLDSVQGTGELEIEMMNCRYLSFSVESISNPSMALDITDTTQKVNTLRRMEHNLFHLITMKSTTIRLLTLGYNCVFLPASHLASPRQ